MLVFGFGIFFWIMEGGFYEGVRDGDLNGY